MASETVRGARMQSIVADEVVGRAVDRLLLRTRGKSNLARADEAPEDENPAGEGPEEGETAGGARQNRQTTSR
jgi:hypothetical protein